MRRANIQVLKKIVNPFYRRLLINKIILFSIAGVILVFTTVIPPNDISAVKCSFYSLTGYPCLTCGMTRSFYSFSHGDFISAFQYHPIGPVLFLYLVWIAIKNLTDIITVGRVQLTLSNRLYRIGFLTIGIVWIFYWIGELIMIYVSSGS